MNEFKLIQHYFSRTSHSPDNILLSIGDDGAIVRSCINEDYVFTLDNLVEHYHFSANVSAHALGHKLAAVNLSDLAAMGAQPRYALLGLTLPKIEAQWMQDFSEGMFSLLNEFQVTLIGGNTTQGPLNLVMQLTGSIPSGLALRRSGSKRGDKIYVSGQLGAASFALYLQKTQQEPELCQRLMPFLTYPQPRVRLGCALRTLASSAIDISDGLLADLNHIMLASNVGARIELEKVPLFTGWEYFTPFEKVINFALTGGDDYELCFTVPAHLEDKLKEIMQKNAFSCTCIGEMIDMPGIHLFYQQKKFPLPERLGYEHFQKN